MSTRFQRILVPVDFQGASIRALELAADLALGDRATVLLAHVVPGSALLLPEAHQTDAPPLGDPWAERQAKQRLAELARAIIPAAVERRQIVRVGDPATELLQLQKECGADLVVMGTHGRSGVARLVLGSVAERLLRDAGCPVMTIRADTGGARAAA